MQSNSQGAGTAPRSFLARFFAALRSRVRRLMGKKEAPNIYPFF